VFHAETRPDFPGSTEVEVFAFQPMLNSKWHILCILTTNTVIAAESIPINTRRVNNITLMHRVEDGVQGIA
jgi:hypothetical protein